MARVNAACSRESASVLDGLRQSVIGRNFQRFAAMDPLLRAAIPVFIAIFLVTIGISGWSLIEASKAEIEEASLEDVEQLAAFLETRLRAEPVPADEAQANRVLNSIMPAAATRRQRAAILADPDGTIHAKSDNAPVSAKTLAELFGPDHPLLLMRERAGAMRVTLPDGTKVFAALHGMSASGWQIVVVQSRDAALAEWRSTAAGHRTLLITAGVVLLCFGMFFHWQGSLIRKADAVSVALNNRIDTALNTGRCGLWDWDLARGRIYWSRSMFAMLNLPEREEHFSFGEINAMIHPGDVDFVRMAEAALAGAISTIDHEFRIRSGSGDWVWIRARAQLVKDPETASDHFVGIAVDTTEQRRQSEARATADLRLRDAIEALSSAFVLWDRENQLVLCNSRFRELHGLSPEASQVGAHYRDVMTAARAIEPMERVIVEECTDTDARAMETLLPDGRWLQINERRTKDGGYVCVGTDISAIKIKQNELLAKQKELVESERRLLATVADLKRSRQILEHQAQQLADLAERYLEQKAEAENANRAKSQFLANMSHEFRTPLNAILGFAEIMERGVYGELGCAKYREYCHDIATSGSKLLALIEDMLKMSELESGRVELDRRATPIDAVIDEAITLIAPKAEAKSQHLHVAKLPGAMVHTDPNAARQILVHILENAVKFTPEHGEIAVRPRYGNGAVNLYIEDTGIGIPAPAIAKITRPFEQVENSISRRHGGSGLGLAIAHSLARLNGGAMRIRSVEGSGTIVMVRLPIAESEAVAKPQAKEALHA